MSTICRHCGRVIKHDTVDGWIDPEATGDDVIWRETCDEHDTFDARHEPQIPTPSDDIYVPGLEDA